MPASTLRVIDYDSSWPQTFLLLKNWFWSSVGDVALAIEHVGSTSVPGMAAKPIIDIDLITTSRTEVPAILLRLGKLGYEHRGDLGIEDREAFKAPENQPAHHLYVCSRNSLALKNHITVRDYLRTHASEAAAYSILKKGLAERFRNERARYNEAKTEFVLSILERCAFSAKELDSIKRANQI